MIVRSGQNGLILKLLVLLDPVKEIGRRSKWNTQKMKELGMILKEYWVAWFVAFIGVPAPTCVAAGNLYPLFQAVCLNTITYILNLTKQHQSHCFKPANFD